MERISELKFQKLEKLELGKVFGGESTIAKTMGDRNGDGVAHKDIRIGGGNGGPSIVIGGR
jgi:hypothetical protein